MDPDQTDMGPHCLPVCKNRFEKFAKILSRRHKQTTVSDAGFLGVLRVKRTSSCAFSQEYSIFGLKALSEIATDDTLKHFF